MTHVLGPPTWSAASHFVAACSGSGKAAPPPTLTVCPASSLKSTVPTEHAKGRVCCLRDSACVAGTQAVGWIAWPYLQGHAKRIPIIIASSRFAPHPFDILNHTGLLHLCVHLCPPPAGHKRRAPSTVPARTVSLPLGKRRPVFRFGSFGLGLCDSKRIKR